MVPRSLVLVVAACAYESSAALLGDRISYLAYGSNLHPAVFERRRGIKPLAMSPAVAPGWRLAFDLRGGGAEPSFASARPDARRELYGALYDLTPSDWARVCASEGVPFGYVVCPVRCRKLDDGDGEIEWAYTLAAAPGPMRIANEADEPVPSERYLGYLREGARLSGLPESWCSYLDDMSRDPAAPLPIPVEDTAWAKGRK